MSARSSRAAPRSNWCPTAWCFERLKVRSRADIEAIREAVESTLAPIGHRVYAVVNYDGFAIEPELVDDYMDMVHDVVERFYSGVTRYTTSAFLRMKLGDAMSRRQVAPHIYESADEALAHLRETGRAG
jgi:propionate CoA-transferase